MRECHVHPTSGNPFIQSSAHLDAHPSGIQRAMCPIRQPFVTTPKHQDNHQQSASGTPVLGGEKERRI